MPHRNLVFCFDGTWTSATERKPGTYYSNVFKISENLADFAIGKKIYKKNAYEEHDQIQFYYPGIGTSAFGLKFKGGIFGKGYERAVEQAYIDLSNNYRDGDNVYIFGYSRGAVVAQVLSKIVSSVGILKANSLEQYSLVWRKVTESYLDDSDLTKLNSALNFRAGNGKVINYLGLFDPVFAGFDFSVGDNFRKLVAPDVGFPEAVANCRVVLALDESRKRFFPFFWQNANPHRLKQFWIPGVHGDIGGINPGSVFSDLALFEICEGAIESGNIAFNQDFLEDKKKNYDNSIRSNSVLLVNNEKNLFWRLLDYLDFGRKRSKLIAYNSKIHNCVKQILNADTHMKYKNKSGKAKNFYDYLKSGPWY